MKTTKVLMAGLLMSTAISTSAHAQSVDYGMLESIFGEPVTTSATGKPQRASEAPVSMEIISSEEIRRSGAKDIPQLLRKYAGVNVNRSAIGRGDVSVRGYNQPFSNRLLVLVNGRQILLDAFGETQWSHIPVQMEEIRQIEVVRGPQSSLFGFNAENGVINIITFSPLQDDVDVATVKVGTQQHKEANVVNTVKINDKMAVRMSAGVLDSDGFNRDSRTEAVGLTGITDERAADDAWTRRSAYIDYEWQVNPNSQIRSEITWDNGVNDQVIPYMGNMGMNRGQRETRSFRLSYKTQNDLGLWDVTAYRNSYDNNGLLGIQNDLNVLKIEDLFKIGSNHAFRIGGEYRQNSLTGSMMGDGNSKFDYELGAISGMWDWQIMDNLSWTNAARYDYVKFGRDEAPALNYAGSTLADYDRKVEEFSFNSGLVYKLTDNDKIRLSAARGLHIPSLIELGSSLDLSSGVFGFYGDPTLQTERNTTVELGYTKSLPEMDSEVGATVYWQRIENVLVTDQVSIIGLPSLHGITFNNYGDSESIGLELSAKGTYNNWLRWGGNYTYVSVKDEIGSDTSSGVLGFEGNQPKHKVSIYGGFDFCRNWEFDSDLTWVSGTHQRWGTSALNTPSVEEHIENYFVLNARMGYKLSENTSFSLDGYNLIDRHREYPSALISGYNAGYFLPGTPPIATTDSAGANVLGRSVLLTMRHKF